LAIDALTFVAQVFVSQGDACQIIAAGLAISFLRYRVFSWL